MLVHCKLAPGIWNVLEIWNGLLSILQGGQFNKTFTLVIYKSDHLSFIEIVTSPGYMCSLHL